MKLLPVVHMQSPDHALRLSNQAMEAGADGIFVIDHLTSGRPDKLAEAYAAVRGELGSSAFIGLNFLGLTPSESAEYIAAHLGNQLPDAFWSDDAVTHARTHNILQLKEALEIRRVRFFGGVAFKYTRSYTSDPELAAVCAREHIGDVDVMTTSGSATGSPATPEKVAAMKEAIGNTPLALASGVSVDNIASYKGVSYVLAASSVETGPYSGIYIPSKLHDLVQAAHEV